MPETLVQTRNRLLGDLQARQRDIDLLYRYYRGDHPLPWAQDKVRDALRMLLALSRSNWCRLVVKATSERLRPIGITFSGSSDGDTAVWERIWQGNRLDLGCRMVHDAALIARRGFVLVWPTDDGPPSVTPEHPSQAIVDYVPGSHWKRRAGLKTFVDVVAKEQYCTLWTPDVVASWRARWSEGNTMASNRQWRPWDDAERNIAPEAENPLGDVPLVEFVGDPAMLGEPMSELDGGVTDIQDRINKTILDRLVAANFSSFKQKWATGLEIPKKADGTDVEPFEAAVDRLWINEDPAGRFGEFGETDLTGYLKSVEADIQHLAAITRTPPHYLLGQSGAFPSGQSLQATETGLVAKVNERRDSLTESWEDAIRLALKADDDSRADDMAMSVMWMNPESRTIAEVHDAALKMKANDVPWRERMEFIGYTPTKIEVMDGERAEDAATNMLAAQSAVTAPPPAQPTVPPAAQPAAPAAS